MRVLRTRLSILKAVAFLLPFLCLGTSSGEPVPVGQTTGGLPDYWSVQIENDFFAASGDRCYTHGFEVIRLQPGPGTLEFGLNPHIMVELGNVHTYGAGGVSRKSSLSATTSSGWSSGQAVKSL